MNFEEYKSNAFKKNPELYKEYNALEQRYKLISEVIKLRAKEKMTQSQLAAKVGTTQRIISNLEGGNYNPSIDFLYKLAAGLGKELDIKFK